MATIASQTAIGQLDSESSAQFLHDLQGLLDKAGRFTGATSAAIAFVEGSELVTKVSMGDCAPDPGSRSPISGSFTGLCVESRDVQRCDDASKDSRVDSGACETLGIASMVIVPIAEKRTVLGVLAAFSPKPSAFSPTHVALLRTIADIVIELRKRYPNAPFGEVAAQAAPAPEHDVQTPQLHNAPEVKAPVATVLPSFASAKPESASAPVEKETPETVAKAVELHLNMAAIPVAPETSKSTLKTDPPLPLTEPRPFEVPVEKKPLGPVLVKPEPKQEPKPESKPVPKLDTTVDLWKREPLLLKNEAEPEEYARLVPQEPVKKSADILSAADDIGPSAVDVNEKDDRPLFGAYNESAAAALDRQRSSESGIRKLMLIAAVLIAVVVGGGWYFMHRGSNVVDPSEVAAATPQPVSTPAQPAASAPASATVQPEAQPAPANISTPASAAPPVAVVLKKTDLKLKNPADGPISSEPDANAIVVDGKSHLPKKVVAEDVDVPHVGASDASGVGKLLGMVKTVQPEASFRSSSIEPPRLLKSVAPNFPAFARQMHIQQDRVVLNATVGESGSITNIKVVRGRPVFVQPAIEAVKQWKYKPAYLNGEATSSTIEVVVNFVDHN
ncbi:MAG TPA: TonB family protein [Terriglobales bacterium]